MSACRRPLVGVIGDAARCAYCGAERGDPCPRRPLTERVERFFVTAPDPCPRCGNEPDSIQEQIRSCAFCRRRSACLLTGRRPPEEPTDEYPTWRPPA